MNAASDSDNPVQIGDEMGLNLTRVREDGGAWYLEVNRVSWFDPGMPVDHWIRFRRWKHQPSPARIEAACAAARHSRRFFLICERCHRVVSRGFMHDGSNCMDCAQQHLGIVY